MNYFERLSYIFSLQSKEVEALETTKGYVDNIDRSLTYHEDENANRLKYREPNLPCDLPQEKERKERNVVTDLPIYTMDEVSYHDSLHDCWIILYDKVYDVSRFLQEHPGGEDVLMEYAGRDATISFRSVGHSAGALKTLEEFLIGTLPERQRLFPSDCQTRWSII